jgi:hypothetical protein
MSSLIEKILAELTQDKVIGIAQNLGESPEKTNCAVQEALPLLVGALSQKSQNPFAVSMLSSLLDKNNDGSMLDDVLKMITGGSNTSAEQKGGMGETLLQLLLGGDSDSVKQRVAASSGIEPSSVAKLLPLLAPIVLSALSKIKSSENLSLEGLTSLLEKESVASKSVPSSGNSGLLNQLLDANNDGNVLDDVVRLGTKILG